MKEMAADCIEKTGATESDINGMVAKETPTTKSGKCLAFCMMNQFNCVSRKKSYQDDDGTENIFDA